MSFEEEEDDEDENSSSSSQLNSNTRPSSATSKKSTRVSEEGWQRVPGLVIQLERDECGETTVTGSPGAGPSHLSRAALAWAPLSSHPPSHSLQPGPGGGGTGEAGEPESGRMTSEILPPGMAEGGKGSTPSPTTTTSGQLWTLGPQFQLLRAPGAQAPALSPVGGSLSPQPDSPGAFGGD